MLQKMKVDVSGWLVVGGLLLGNFYYSVAKKSLPVAIPQLERTLSVTTEDLGKISSSFSIAYGVGKIIGGVVCDMLSPYILYVVGLYLAAFVNLSIIFVDDIPSITEMWALNAFLQGVGGPALSKLVVEWFPRSTRTNVWANLTFACNLGYLLSPAILRPFCSTGWKGAFVATGVGSLVAAAGMTVAYLAVLRGRTSQLCVEQTNTTTTITTTTTDTTTTTVNLTPNGNQVAVGDAGAAMEERVAGAEDLQQDSLNENTGNETAGQPESASGLRKRRGSRSDRNSDSNRDTTAVRSSSNCGAQAAAEKAPSAPTFTSLLIVKFLLLFGANVLTYFVSKGVQDWTGDYLTKYLHYPRDPTGSTGSSGHDVTLFGLLQGVLSGQPHKGPEMQIWELALWPELGGMVGSVLVGRVAVLLHDRHSLACCLFTLVCIAGLWGLALHLPLDPSSAAAHYMPGMSAYYTPYYAEGVLHADGAKEGACLDPGQLAQAGGGGEGVCVPIDPLAVVQSHPLAQCKSLLLHTIALMFPTAGSKTLALHKLAMRVGERLLSAVTYRVGRVGGRFGSMRCALFLIGLGINGPKTLVAFELLSIVPPALCGTITGVAGLFAQIGASYAGTFIAATVVHEGWCSFVALLAVGSTTLAVLLFLSALI